MILHSPHLCTKIQIWQPKYHTEDSEDWEVWLSKNKVLHASPVILVEFTKAKHLKNQRFCVRRQDAERSPEGTNGRIPVYKVPFSKLGGWKSAKEVNEIALKIFEED